VQVAPWCRRFAWRAAVGQQCTRSRGALGTRRARCKGAARGAVFGARGQNLDCVDVVKVAPVARGRMATRRRAAVPSAD
jgi:hypothetical protein